MQMLSTRGAAAVSPSQAILRGLAPDGGLYVPEKFPQFTAEEIMALAPLSYQQRALAVLSRFLPDFTEEELKTAIAGAYGTGFDHEAVAPMVKVGDWAHALELWHGPTLAFKDMALQLLPYLLTMSGKKHGETREVFILVATSGDTGKAGLPVGRLICASNENNVLTDFIKTGVYDISDRSFFRTISPSMDILISSNLERLLFDLAGQDGEKIAGLMAQLKAERRYEVSADMLEKLQEKYAAGYVNEDGIRDEICRAWNEDHYLMDTHTAVASAVLREYQQKTGDKTVSVIVSTASPYKFGASVLEAVAGETAVSGMDDFACCAALSALTGTREPDQIANLPQMPVRHTAVCEKDAMDKAVLDAVK